MQNRIRTGITAALMFVAGIVLAEITPRQDYTSDCSLPPTKRSLTFIQGGTQKLGWTFKQGTTAKDLTGATLTTFTYAPTDRAWSQVVTGALDVATNGSVLVTFTAAQLNTNSTTAYDWLLEVADGDENMAYAYGKLTLLADPAAGITNSFPTQIQTVDWSDVAAYSHTYDYGPVRPDGTTITATTNGDGSIVLKTVTITGASLTNGILTAGGSFSRTKSGRILVDTYPETAITGATMTAGGSYSVSISGHDLTITYPSSVVTSLLGDTEFVITGSGGAGLTGSIGSTIARDAEVDAATGAVYTAAQSGWAASDVLATGQLYTAASLAWAASDLLATQALYVTAQAAWLLADVSATGNLYTVASLAWAAADTAATSALYTTASSAWAAADLAATQALWITVASATQVVGLAAATADAKAVATSNLLTSGVYPSTNDTAAFQGITLKSTAPSNDITGGADCGELYISQNPRGTTPAVGYISISGPHVRIYAGTGGEPELYGDGGVLGFYIGSLGDSYSVSNMTVGRDLTVSGTLIATATNSTALAGRTEADISNAVYAAAVAGWQAEGYATNAGTGSTNYWVQQSNGWVQLPEYSSGGGSSSLSINGYTLAIDCGDWNGDMSGGGSLGTGTNNVVFTGYSTANATNNSKAGDAWYSTETVLNDKYYYKFAPAPPWASRLNAITIMVRSGSPSTVTNYVNMLFDDTINTTSTNNLVSSTADEWNSYTLDSTQINSAWTNAMPGFLVGSFTNRGVNVRADAFVSQSQSIQCRVWLDWR